MDDFNNNNQSPDQHDIDKLTALEKFSLDLIKIKYGIYYFK
ncbi:hypothetical protein [Chryseobacterium sediminis]|nr:hypothetical protein [Chryseobacterium sediminis]